ncbi:MAG TPA: hypothetical protein VF618_25235 [Thermoanaerobaculia bacterium]
MANSNSNTLPVSSIPLTPEEAVQQFRAMRDRIPEFGVLPAGEPSRLAAAANVTPEFIGVTITAVSAAEPLPGVVGSTPDEMRLELEATQRWASVLDELDALRAGIAGALTTRRYRLGLKALQIYQVCQQLVRSLEFSNLKPLVDAMKRTNRFNRRRTTAEQPEKKAPEQTATK